LFDFSLITANADALQAGLWLTIRLCFAGIVLGILGGGTLLGLKRLAGPRLGFLYRGYITLFRGTPLLVQLYLVYYGGPHFGLDWPAEQVGIIGLALYGAAYFAEIFRASMEAVSHGQIEAARDLGMTPAQTLRVVVWPQMLARCMPPLVGQTVILVKESSVLSIITVPELTTIAMRIANENFAILEPYAVLALTYWALTLAVAHVGHRIEQRFTRHLVRTT
jgi:polar amino acid transport system permease protein